MNVSLIILSIVYALGLLGCYISKDPKKERISDAFWATIVYLLILGVSKGW